MYQWAVEKGQFEAARPLGDIFRDGKGDIKKDPVEAKRYYELARKNGIKVD